ncbi:hypothetical protein X962_5499 [Burkholderia pseudomallei MSHR7343]|nr:hypothetical protein DO70_4777 [Burkholderia pseudomallei]KGS21159.1 hypothetical protein X962_5499 [Burkholderia pseudomallei MSHR7343]
MIVDRGDSGVPAFSSLLSSIGIVSAGDAQVGGLRRARRLRRWTCFGWDRRA